MAQTVPGRPEAAEPAAQSIERPAPGSVAVVDVAGAKKLAFKFDFKSAKVVVLDVDVILTFPDGGKLVIPGFGLSMMTQDPPKLEFSDGEVVPEEFLSTIQEVKLLEQNTQLKLTSAEEDKQGGEGDYDVPPKPVATPVRSMLEERPPVRPLVSEGVPLSTLSPSPLQPTSSGSSSKGPTNPFNDKTGNITDLELNQKLFTSSTTSSSAGRIGAAYAAAPAEADSSYGAQASPAAVTGTEQGEVITRSGRADSFQRIVEIAPALSQAYSVKTLKISGLPAGVSVVGVPGGGSATLVDGAYVVDADTSGGAGKYRFILEYRLPPDTVGPDDKGFYDGNGYTGRFTASITFTTEINGRTVLATGSSYFGVRAVNGSSDVVYTDPQTGASVAVLWANPPGLRVDARGGNDTVYATAGQDTLDGGAGDNEVRYDASHTAVNVRLGDGDAQATVSGGTAKGDILTHFVHITGSTFADTITGNSQNNRLVGGDGNDRVSGLAGNDTFAGGKGADTYSGGDGSRDLVDYSASTEGVTVKLSSGVNRGGDAEGDFLEGIEDVVGSWTKSNNLTGDNKDNVLTGGLLADTFDGGGGADTFHGGGGKDVVSYAESGPVVVDLANGAATHEGAGVSWRADVLDGILGVVGSSYADSLAGNDGDNTFDGGRGADTMDGGRGNDTYVVDSEADVIIEGADTDGGIDTVQVKYEPDAFGSVRYALNADAGVENLEYLGRGAFSGVGSSYNNLIVASNSSGATLDGSSGADTLVGGVGNDVYFIDAVTMLGGDGQVIAGDVVVELSDSGIDEIRSTAVAINLANYRNVENLRFIGTGGFTGLGSDLDNRIVGLFGNDSLFGGKGSDTLEGDSGADTLDGGEGADSMAGGYGNDTYIVDDANDQVSESSDRRSGNDTIRTSLSSLALSGNFANVENLIATDRGRFTGIGNTSDNRIEGSRFAASSLMGLDGDDTLVGGQGADTLDGGVGADSMAGGAGDDTYLVDDDGDQIVEGENEGIDTVRTTTSSYTLGANLDVLVYAGESSLGFTGSGNELTNTLVGAEGADSLWGGGSGDLLVGNGGADTLDGGIGIDTLDGGSGDDVLIGGEGADSINGGSGSDTADYSRSSAGVNVDLTRTGVQLGGDADGDRLTAVENVTGARYAANTLAGDSAGNHLTGGDLGDILRGAGGADTIEGGGGNDSILGSADGADSIDGGADADTIDGQGSADTVLGGAGDDRIAVYAAGRYDAGGNGGDTLVLASGSTVAGGGNVSVDFGAATSASQVTGGGFSSFVTGFRHLDARGFGQNLSVAGTSGAETILGGSGRDTIAGGGGDDSVDAGAGTDRVTAGLTGTYDGGTDIANSVDTLVLGPTPLLDAVTVSLRDNTVTGGGYNARILGFEAFDGTGFEQALSLVGRANAVDRIVGGDRDDTIDGLGGLDRISGEAGSDRITLYADGIYGGGWDASGGIDTLVLTAASTAVGAVTINLAETEDSQVFGGSFTGFAVDFENVDASNGFNQNLRVLGTTGAETIRAGSGADTLDGLGGADSIDGGAGNDLITGASDAQTLSGGSGADTIDGRGGADIVDAGDGADRVTVYSAGTYEGGGDSAADTLVLGDAAATRVTVDLGSGSVSGSGYAARATGFEIFDGAGPSGPLSVLGRGSGAETIRGGSGDDTLDGLGSADSIDGGAGSDRITLYAAGTYDGGAAASDTMVLTAASTGMGAVTIDLAQSATSQVTGGFFAGRATGFENIDASNGFNQNLRVFGTTGAETILGGAGADTLEGRGGADFIDGGAGADRIIGGPDSGETLSGGAGADTVEGGNGSDLLLGGTENDSLSGGGSADTLDGGSGADIMAGGDGNDVYVVDDAGDTIREAASEGSADVIITSLTSLNLGDARYANVENLAYRPQDGTSAEAFTGIGASGAANSIVGGDNNDVLYGDAQNDTANGGDDTLDGGKGNDSLDGGLGNDLLRGGEGADTLDGGAGTDIADYSGSTSDAGVTIDLALAGPQSGGDAQGDMLRNVEGVIGTRNADVLTGTRLADLISGGAGDDTITGRGGADTIDGGDGNDVISVGDNGFLTGLPWSQGGRLDPNAVASKTVGSDAFSLAFRINVSPSASDYTGSYSFLLTDDFYQSDNKQVINFGINPTLNSISYSVRGSSRSFSIPTNAVRFADQEWHSVALTVSPLVNGSRTLRFFVDGVEVFSAANVGVADVGLNPRGMFLASNNNGSIDEVGVFNRALSSAEIRQLYLGSVAGISDVLGYWSFDDPADRTAATAGPNATAWSRGSFGHIPVGQVQDLTGASLNGGRGADSVTGGLGADTLDGGSGADTLRGGAGNDLYIDRANDADSDTILEDANAGTDTVLTTRSTFNLSGIANVENLMFRSVDAAGNLVAATAGVSAVGNALANSIQGGLGADTLNGGTGADTLEGGAGDDVYIINDTNDTVVETATGGTDTVRTTLAAFSLADTRYANVENLVFAGTGAFSGVGNELANRLASEATAGATLNGGLGNDTLVAGAGADSLDGGGDIDMADYSNSTAAVNVGLDRAASSNTGGFAAGDVLANIENLIGSRFADTLVGNAGDNVLNGGLGNDSMSGGAGNDTYWVDSSGDVVSEAVSQGIDTVMSTFATYSLSANVENLAFVSASGGAMTADASGAGNSGANSLVGGTGNDTLDGLDGADTLDGGAGADSLNGGAGNDVFLGGDGADTMFGGGGNDTADYSRSAAGVTVDLSVTAAQSGGDAAGDILRAIRNVTGSSTAGNVLTGNAGANVLTGGSGNDTISGGGGNDTISGGGGNDLITSGDRQASFGITIPTPGASTSAASNTISNPSGATDRFDPQSFTLSYVLTPAAGAGARWITVSAFSNTFYLGTNGTGSVTATIFGQSQTWRPAPGITDGQPHVLSAVVSGRNATLYLDGVSLGSIDMGAALNASVPQNFTIGYSIGAGATSMQVDDILLYKGALSPEQIATIAANPKGVTSGLLIGYDFNQADPRAPWGGSLSSLGGRLTNWQGTLAQVGSSIDGGAGNDTINAAAYDTITGGADDDRIIFAAAASLDGGTGRDTLVITGNSVSRIDLDAVSSTTTSGAAGAATVSGFENVDASGSTVAMTVSSSTAANLIVTGSGADSISNAAGGADTIRAGAGADRVLISTLGFYDGGVEANGADGSDTLVLAGGASANGAVSIDLSSRTNEIAGGGGFSGATAQGFEHLDASGFQQAVSVLGTGGAETILGGAGADTFDGLGGMDSILGNGGDDVFIFRNGLATLDGGTGGSDTLVLTEGQLTGVTSNLVVSLASTVAGGQIAVTGMTTVVRGMENIDASTLSRAVTMTGDTSANWLRSGGGADCLVGGAGADTLDGGVGNDTLDGGADNNLLIGGLGNDRLVAGSGADTLDGGDGDDALDGGGGADSLSGGIGQDRVTITRNSSADGGVGIDTLVLSDAAAASVPGSVAIDLRGGSVSGGGYSAIATNFEFVDFTALNRAASVLGRGGGFISAGTGDDTIDSGVNADVDGGAGDDRIIVYSHTSNFGRKFSGGADGTFGDTMVLQAGSGGTATGTTTVNLGETRAGQSQVTGVGFNAGIFNFEHLDAASFDRSLSVTGTARAETLIGGTQSDTILGNGGDDTIDGGLGGGSISGGDGADRITIYSTGTYDGGNSDALVDTLALNASAGFASLTINLGAATQASGAGFLATGFEAVDASSGYAGTLSVTGRSNAETIRGGAGADTLDGQGGADSINGGGGADRITAYATGAYDGGSVDGALDTLVLGGWTGPGAAVSVNLGTGSVTDGVTSATARNFEIFDGTALVRAVSVAGTANAETILGSAQGDTLDGGGGPDSVSGLSGFDRITIYAGGTYDGGTGIDFDTLAMSAWTGAGTGAAVRIDITGGTVTDGTNTARASNFEVVDGSLSAQALSVLGRSATADTIIGSNQGDTLDGQGGADSVNGGRGADRITVYATGTYDGGNVDTALDTLVLKTGVATGNVTVNLGTSSVSGGGFNATARNFEIVDGSGFDRALSVAGTASAETIRGTAQADTLDGQSGADSVDGGGGADRIAVYTTGTYDGGSVDGALDTLVLGQAATGTVTVDLSAMSVGGGGYSALARNFEIVDGAGFGQALSVAGSASAETIRGTAQADTLDGRGGADSIDGGSVDGALDTLVLGTATGTGAVSIDLAAGTVTGGGYSATASNFEIFDGAGFARALSVAGTVNADTIRGGDANDTLDSRGGADSVSGGSGADRITIYANGTYAGGTDAGTDTLVLDGAWTHASALSINLGATPGPSQVTGTNFAATVTGFERADVSNYAGALSILGASAAESILGGRGGDTIDGGGGADSINAASGADRVSVYTGGSYDGGTSGTDLDTLVLWASASSAVTVNLATGTVTGGGYAARVSNFEIVDGTGFGQALSVTGTANAETIRGTNQNDTLDGSGGADSVDGGAGADRITAYAGGVYDGGTDGNSDTLVLGGWSGAGSIAVDLGAGTVSTGSSSATIRNFEVFDGTGLTRNLSVTGRNSGAETILGGGGDDTLDGKGGTESVDGGGGADRITVYANGTYDGGSGTDLDSFVLDGSWSATGPLTINLAAAAGQVTGSGFSGLVRGFERFDVASYGGALSITGTSGAESILGGQGGDTIDGQGGADCVDGGGGADRITIYANGTYDGGSDADAFVLDGGWSVAGPLTINLAAAAGISQVTGTGFAGLVRGFERFDVASYGGALSIVGASGAESILGGLGNDTIDGQGGADSIDGGGGADRITAGASGTYDGGSSAGDLDTLVLRTGLASGAVTVNLNASTVSGGSFNATARNFEIIDGSTFDQALSVTGTANAETIRGTEQNDTLDGQGGTDSIDGGGGADRITVYATGTYDGSSVDGALDTLVLGGWTGTGAAVTLNLGTGNVTDGSASAIARNFEVFDGTGFRRAVSVVGTASAETIRGTNQNDTLDGSGGADSVDGGAGADRITAYAGGVYDGGTDGNSDTLVLGAWTGTGSIAVDLGAGTVSTGSSSATIRNFEVFDGTGLTRNLSVTGRNSGAETILGGGGDDTLDGKGGTESVDGGGGADRITIYANGTYDGGSGASTDTFVLDGGWSATGPLTLNLAATAGQSQVTGPGFSGLVRGFERFDVASYGGALSILGTSGAESILGGQGGDTIDGGGGTDSVDGGGGVDRITVYANGTYDGGSDGNSDTLVLGGWTGAGPAVTVDLGTGSVTDGSASATARAFEVFDGTGFGRAVSVVGTANGETILGTAQNDTLDGSGGVDSVDGGNGADRITAYAGGVYDGGTDGNSDTLVLAGWTGVGSAVAVNLASGSVSDGSASAVARNFEVFDGAGFARNLSVAGRSGVVDTIGGGAGSDTLDGAGGADSVDGGGGADRITVYANGTYDGGSGTDLDSFVLDGSWSAAGPLTINLAAAAGQSQVTGAGFTGLVRGFERFDVASYEGSLSIVGTSGAESILGGQGGDTIDGGGGTDSVEGGNGADRITAYAGGIYDGGSDGNTDTLVLGGWTGAAPAVTINLGTGVVTDGSASATARSFEVFDGTGFGRAVSVVGTASAETIHGTNQNDTLDGAGGADSVDGGNGADRITAYAGGVYDGGTDTANDTLVLTAASSFPAALSIDLADATNQLKTGTATARNFEFVDALAFDKALTVTGSNRAELIRGGTGDDFLDGRGGNDLLNAGSVGANTVWGGDGADVITLYAGGGSYDGGSDAAGNIDTLSITVSSGFSATGSTLTLDLAGGVASDGTRSASVSGFERISASSYNRALSVIGTAAAETIQGGLMADTIDGGRGRDSIDAGVGADRITIYATGSYQGGSDASGSIDTFVLDGKWSVAGPLIIDLAAGSQVTGTGFSASVAGFEQFDVSRYQGTLSVVGAAGDETILGGLGADTIAGNGGDDSIDGGTSAGDAAVFTGAAHDYDFTVNGDGTLTVRDLVSGRDGTDRLKDIEVLRFNGSDHAVQIASDPNTGQSLTGQDNQRDALFGRDGDDTLDGRSGHDLLAGGGGADSISGGDGNDTLYGQAGADTLLGGSNEDRLYGGADNDSLDGGTGADTLSGDDGADTLRGSMAEGDRLDGGQGDDLFLIDTTSLNIPPGSAAVDGGAGSDTVRFTSEVTQSQFDALSEDRGGAGSIISHVETLDFASNGAADTISLSGDQLGRLSDTGSLTIQAGAGDVFTLDSGISVDLANSTGFTQLENGSWSADANSATHTLQLQHQLAA